MKTNPIKQWDKRVWGVRFDNGFDDQTLLLGLLWNNTFKYATHDGDPLRPLLFNSRRLAREWCTAQMDQWKIYSVGHPVRKWRVRPVRVRATFAVEE